jgi:hypothetical protein
MAIPWAARLAFLLKRLEVTLMLRLLLTNLTGKQADEARIKPAPAERPVTPTTVTVPGGPKTGRSYPKSVCTSLKDLCEL